MLRSKLADVPPDAEVLRFGNECYHVDFVEREHKGVFGHQYTFYLQDAIDEVPEYLVDWDNFVS
jgi:mRNA (guanine-N7-)-methyltransferase